MCWNTDIGSDEDTRNSSDLLANDDSDGLRHAIEEQRVLINVDDYVDDENHWCDNGVGDDNNDSDNDDDDDDDAGCSGVAHAGGGSQDAVGVPVLLSRLRAGQRAPPAHPGLRRSLRARQGRRAVRSVRRSRVR